MTKTIKLKIFRISGTYSNSKFLLIDGVVHANTIGYTRNQFLVNVDTFQVNVGTKEFIVVV